MNSPLPHSHWIHYEGDPQYPLRNGFPREPVKLAIITSVRDVLGDDQNGQQLRLPDGRHVYMEGATEHLIHQTRESELGQILRVVGIITDDIPRDEQRYGTPMRPQDGRPWIHQLDLRNDRDELVAGSNFTHWIPSRFRDLDLKAIDERARGKEDFERQVLMLMEQLDADVLLSDHLMLKLEDVIDQSRGAFGRVLNIHPAVTKEAHPFRFTGQHPTQDAINHANTGRPTFTGATLHVIDTEIDHGPIIAYSAHTPVHPDHDPMELRYDNYRYGKLPVLVAGLRHYIHHILPHLDQMDLFTLSPLNDVSDPPLVHRHHRAPALR